MKTRGARLVELLPVWAATASLLFTSAAYGWFWRTATPLVGIDAYWLVGIVIIEFLVIHSFPFLTMVVLQRSRLPQWHGVRGLAFGVLLLAYLAASHSAGGWHGVELFLSLTAVTYLGFFVSLEERIHKLPELGLRWLCNTVLLASLGAWFQLPSDSASWSVGDGVLPLGGWYFLGLAGLETSGLYRQPFLLDAGRRARKRFAPIGNALPRTPELQSRQGDLYWAVVPILGSAAFNFLPLVLAGYVAGAGARLIDRTFEWPRSERIEQWWFPSILALILLTARWCQLHWLLRGRARRVATALLVALYLLVAVLRYRADPTYHFAYVLFPEDAYAGFFLLEVPLLLFLVPATWLALAFPK